MQELLQCILPQNVNYVFQCSFTSSLNDFENSLMPINARELCFSIGIKRQ